MGKQARRVPKFGAFLKKKRGERSLQSVVNQLKPVGVSIATTALFKYEDEGRVPPTDVVRGFAIAYDTPLTELVDRLLAELHVKPVDWREGATRQFSWEFLRDDARACGRRRAKSGRQTPEKLPL